MGLGRCGDGQVCGCLPGLEPLRHGISRNYVRGWLPFVALNEGLRLVGYGGSLLAGCQVNSEPVQMMYQKGSGQRGVERQSHGCPGIDVRLAGRDIEHMCQASTQHHSRFGPMVSLHVADCAATPSTNGPNRVGPLATPPQEWQLLTRGDLYVYIPLAGRHAWRVHLLAGCEATLRNVVPAGPLPPKLLVSGVEPEEPSRMGGPPLVLVRVGRTDRGYGVVCRMAAQCLSKEV